MKITRFLVMAVGLFLIGCMIFYVGCSQTGNPQDPKNTGSPAATASASASPNASSSPTSGKVTILAKGLTNTYDLAVSGGYVYFTEKISGAGGVYKIKADGTDTAPTAVASGYTNSYSLCVAGTDIYFTQNVGTGQGTVMKTSTTATSSTTPTTFISGRTNPCWIRYNSTDGYIYWTEYTAAGGSLMRALAGSTTPVAETVCTGMTNPYAFTIDSVNSYAYIGEMAGTQTSRLLRVPLGKNQTAVTVYSGAETYYITGICFDASNGYVYWSNYLSNSGVFRLDVTATTPKVETVETGMNSIFSVQGPYSGLIYLSNNTPMASGGSIYTEKVSSITSAAVNVRGTTTADSPFMFTVTGGAIYWTEYPGFSNTSPIDSGGSSSCRVMKYTL